VLRPKIDVKGVAGSDAPATRQNYKPGVGAGYRATRAKAMTADVKGTGSNFQQSDPDPVTTMERNVANKMMGKKPQISGKAIRRGMREFGGTRLETKAAILDSRAQKNEREGRPRKAARQAATAQKWAGKADRQR
jgi:hypothetical protein